MKKTLITLLIGSFFMVGTSVSWAEEAASQPENQDWVGTVLTSPIKWTGSTLTYFGKVIGLPFGAAGNPQENWNYAGEGDTFGFYESYSNDSEYRYQRYGVN